MQNTKMYILKYLIEIHNLGKFYNPFQHSQSKSEFQYFYTQAIVALEKFKFRISKYSLIAIYDKVLLLGGIKDGELSSDIYRNGI